jgi:hypothetical protein
LHRIREMKILKNIWLTLHHTPYQVCYKNNINWHRWTLEAKKGIISSYHAADNDSTGSQSLAGSYYVKQPPSGHSTVISELTFHSKSAAIDSSLPRLNKVMNSNCSVAGILENFLAHKDTSTRSSFETPGRKEVAKRNTEEVASQRVALAKTWPPMGQPGSSMIGNAPQHDLGDYDSEDQVSMSKFVGARSVSDI